MLPVPVPVPFSFAFAFVDVDVAVAVVNSSAEAVSVGSPRFNLGLFLGRSQSRGLPRFAWVFYADRWTSSPVANISHARLGTPVGSGCASAGLTLSEALERVAASFLRRSWAVAAMLAGRSIGRESSRGFPLWVTMISGGLYPSLRRSSRLSFLF